MGKNQKEHRKKIAKRNEKLTLEKNKIKKFQQEFLKDLIEQEKQRGLFNNPITTDTFPVIDNLGLPTGPQI